MPEGHTIHALADRLQRRFGGPPVTVTSPQGRFAEAAALVDGHELLAATSAGKHLFLEFGRDGEGVDRFVHVHLGLIGSFVVQPQSSLAMDADGGLAVVGAVRLRLAADGYVADLRGPNLCQLIDGEEVGRVVAGLGPDPLRHDADPDRAWRKISRSSRSIAELLMDQSVLAGVGNVYRCEVLFRHRLAPLTPGSRVRPASWRTIWADLVELLPLGVAFGQILTMPDQVEEAHRLVGTPEQIAHMEGLNGERLGTWFPREFFVYQRTDQPCRVCGSRIRTQVVAGRNLFWCARCQRRR
ncbi:MAG: Fpg/Nei family DNA glycosylase [Austwickia sp.]|nr:Fpg/Nei family DNA glycosylase [Austwickia sp.]MBK8437919.1 Fpg/Nei family DNA glycosylase [Austwickia sp.]MBK9100220.1 Fpg/Nei family DNA glycosylase [Austwickia sp.]